MKKVILLLNMGGPNNLDEVSVFLKNMFDDPYILQIKSDFLRKAISRIITFFRTGIAKKNYILLGGKSPINDTTMSLVNKLNAKFNKEIVQENSGKDEIKFDFIMNYTPPFANEVLKKYSSFDEIILFPLYPHYSKTTVASSLDDANLAIKNLNIKSEVKVIEPFFKDGEYNKIILELIKDEIKGLNTDEISNLDLIFSAHSLPKKHILKGDIYEEHIKSHVEILKKLLKDNGILFKNISLAYQSRLGPVEWLGPNLSEVLENLESKRALVFPIAFCIDNSETDFELTIEYKKIADRRAFSFYKVSRCPNDSDKFVQFILSKL